MGGIHRRPWTRAVPTYQRTQKCVPLIKKDYALFLKVKGNIGPEIPQTFVHSKSLTYEADFFEKRKRNALFYVGLGHDLGFSNSANCCSLNPWLRQGNQQLNAQKQKFKIRRTKLLILIPTYPFPPILLDSE